MAHTHRIACILALAVCVSFPAAAELANVNDYRYARGGFQASPHRGIRLAMDDGRYELRVGTRLHLDAYYFDEDLSDLGDDNFDVRRFRLYTTLTLFEDWKLKLDGEISDGEERRGWRNLWLSYKGLEGFRFRAGNQIAPMSIEETTSSNDLTFMERSLPNALVPSYLTGLSALYHGQERWTAAVGVFGQKLGDSDNDKRRVDGVAVVARGTVLPWSVYEEGKLVHLGASFEYRDVNSRFRLRSRPESGGAERLINTGRLRDVTDALTFGIEAAGVWGPYSVQGEYLRSAALRDGRSDLAFDGGYVQLSWLVTGETRRYSRTRATFISLRPKSEWGAVEVATRWSTVDLTDDDVIGGDEWNVTVGVNWYLTRYVRAMFNYVHADARRRRDQAADRPQIYQFRMQFAI